MIKVTADEHVHISKVLPELIEKITKSNNMTATIGKLLFTEDGVYEGNDIFRCTADNGIVSCIKVRKNARVRWKKGYILRNLPVISQNDLKRWKESIVIYGQRWIIETVFSTIKRMFDSEYVYSVKFENMVKEMTLKASLYNKIISI